MSAESDARRLLGVGADATADDVRAARRRLAKELHPDVAGGDADAMRELNEAMAVVLAEIGRTGAGGGRRGGTGPPTFRSQWQGRPSGGFRQHVTMPVGARRRVVRDRGAPGRGVRGAARRDVVGR